MVEALMYFGMGFLLAALGTVISVSLIHARAVRLTKRRLEHSVPTCMAEIMADKDLLRAEFAMSTRRLEIERDELKAKSAHDHAELGRKTDAIHRLKNELTALRSQLDSAKEKIAQSSSGYGAPSDLADHHSGSTISNAHTASPALASARTDEIAALKTQVESLSKLLAEAGAEIRTAHAEQIELETARQTLAEERMKFEIFHRRIAELVQQIIKQTTDYKRMQYARFEDSNISIAKQPKLFNHHIVEKPAA